MHRCIRACKETLVAEQRATRPVEAGFIFWGGMLPMWPFSQLVAVPHRASIKIAWRWQ